MSVTLKVDGGMKTNPFIFSWLLVILYCSAFELFYLKAASSFLATVFSKSISKIPTNQESLLKLPNYAANAVVVKYFSLAEITSPHPH